ncbi:hypothetical protein [Alkalimarinus coralli]|uniref:hypothetical protein n=1 Tax=Alkalimarinus coralli TaxID=2935863 RepID=UPI00202B999E|nr:hypothetical protein [Alkalimarinus coralli]
MSTKQALLYSFTAGAVCLFCTWLFGHLWVFIAIVFVASMGIAVKLSEIKSISEPGKKEDQQTQPSSQGDKKQ